MRADLEENQVGTLRIADEQPQLILVAVDQKAMSAEDEIEPGADRFVVADKVDNPCVTEKQHVVADDLPRSEPRQSGKMARAIGRSFVYEYHGVHKISRHQ